MYFSLKQGMNHANPVSALDWKEQESWRQQLEEFGRVSSQADTVLWRAVLAWKRRSTFGNITLQTCKGLLFFFWEGWGHLVSEFPQKPSTSLLLLISIDLNFFLFSERSGWLIWEFHYLEVALFSIPSYFVFLISIIFFLFTVNLSFALSFVNCLKFWHHALIIVRLLTQPNSLWSIFLFVSPFLLCFIHILT